MNANYEYKFSNFGGKSHKGKNMRIAVVFGTRPEIIKLSLLIKYLTEDEELETYLIHSGQHYDYEMSSIFLKELNVPYPHCFLEVGSGTHNRQISQIMLKLERFLKEDKINHTVVLGDTNTTLAAALSAKNLRINVSHLEAGCRCYDDMMQEEMNRRLVDHISTYLFAPSEQCVKNLRKEGITKNVYHFGNTLVDVLLSIKNRKTDIQKKLNLKRKKYAIITAHRVENVDNEKNLSDIIYILKKFPIDIVFPIHPRTQKNIRKFGIKIPENIIITKPLGYSDFINLLKGSILVLTDSGGVVEEAAILNVPCVTLRDRTEWVETLKCGKNFLTGTNPEITLSLVNKIVNNKDFYNKIVNSDQPFPFVNASKRIYDFLKSI